MFDYLATGGVTELADARPGPDSVTALAALDLDVLTADAQVDVLMAIERQIGWLQGMQQRVLAGIDARLEATAPRARPPLANLAREEVGCALRLAPGTAADRLAIAGTLCDRLPATLHALESGQITYWHARALAEAAIRLDAATAARVEHAVLPDAGEQSVGRFRTAVAEALLAIDPAPAEERHDRALADRCVRMRPAEDGLASLWALLPAEGAAALMQAVDALASVTSADDVRTGDQRRADALVDLGVAALHEPALPRAQGLRPHVQVTISLSTLLGLDEHPAELAGHGPIPADELIRFFTLMPGDVAFVNGHRGETSRIGIAVQLCTLPWLGFVPDDVVASPAAAVQRLGQQLSIPAAALRDYGAREQTRTDHLREVAAFLGWRAGAEVEFKELDQFLLARAMEHDSPSLLFELACDQLRSSRLIRPGPVWLGFAQ